VSEGRLAVQQGDKENKDGTLACRMGNRVRFTLTFTATSHIDWKAPPSSFHTTSTTACRQT